MEVFFWLAVVVVILLAMKRAQEQKADPEAFKLKLEEEKDARKKAIKAGAEMGGTLLRILLKK